MSFTFNPYSGELLPSYEFDMTKLIVAYFILSTTPPLLYRQTTLESYIVDNNGNFIIFG